MHNKGSMELSVNSIVILVIAVVMMGLILGFIRSKFTEVGGSFLVDESSAPEATASDPITMSRTIVQVSGVKRTGLNINLYNLRPSNVINMVPLFHCQSPGDALIIQGEYFNKTINTSIESVSYTGNIKIKTSVPKDTYLCKVCFTANNNTAKTTLCNAATNRIAEKEFKLIVQ